MAMARYQGGEQLNNKISENGVIGRLFVIRKGVNERVVAIQKGVIVRCTLRFDSLD